MRRERGGWYVEDVLIIFAKTLFEEHDVLAHTFLLKPNEVEGNEVVRRGVGGT